MNDSPPTAEAPLAATPAEAARLDAEDSWLEHAEELPARPRRRVLAPLPVTLLLALALACGFIAGVIVQKGQGSSASGGNGFPALRGAAGFGSASSLRGGSGNGSPAATGSGSTSGSDSSPAFGDRPSDARTGGATIGQVAYVSKGALYVTSAEGNTVKVTAAPGSKITKTVDAHVGGIHPGETVLVSGRTNANGSIAASSIRAGDAGGFGGGGPFGAGGDAGGGAPRGGDGSGAGGGESANASSGGQALFGKE